MAMQMVVPRQGDAMLIRALETERSPANIIRTEFDEWVGYNKQSLIDAEIIGYVSPEEEMDGHRGLLNVTGLQRLHSGAIWQQRAMFEEMKLAIEQFNPGFLAFFNDRLTQNKLPVLV